MVVAMSVIVGVIEIALFIVVMLELAIMCMLMNRLFCCRLCHLRLPYPRQRPHAAQRSDIIGHMAQVAF